MGGDDVGLRMKVWWYMYGRWVCKVRGDEGVTCTAVLDVVVVVVKVRDGRA